MATFPHSAISKFNCLKEENYFLLRSLMTTTIFLALLGGLHIFSGNVAMSYQQSQTGGSAKNKTQKNEKLEKVDKNQPTAEQIAESTIFVYGSRPVLDQIRRNGVERGRITRITSDGKSEESSYERRFVRGESIEKDKIRLDQKNTTLEYTLVYGGGRLWGIINGAAFTPRQDAANTFLSQHRHSLDSLLRYKENGSTLALVGKEKQKGIDLFVIDLVDKDKQSTRYYISAKSLHVLWLVYQEPSGVGGQPIKYERKFFDYRYAQSTLVPYRIVLMEEGKQTQETRVSTVSFGIKIDDALFKSPEA
jgi:hypothetical protein